VIENPSTVTTVTLNPAMDEAVGLERFELGTMNRCVLDNFDPGGKGVNVSRVLHRLGCPTLALGFEGGSTGDLLLAELEREGVPYLFFAAGGNTRINLMIYERATGRRTRLYLAGPPVSPGALAELDTALERVASGEIVVLGGSLPPGLPDDTYAAITHSLRARGVRAIVDTSGVALEHAVSAAPFLVKPNVWEAQELLGRTLAGDDDVLEAALEIRRSGPEYVVISQAADGAIAVGPENAWKVTPPSVDARSTVGSGDSMVAGIAAGLCGRAGFLHGLVLGTAAGAATAIAPGTHLCSAGDIQRLLPGVRVHELSVRTS